MGEGLFQPWHLFLILVIALLLFGPKRLPEIGKGIGDGFRALKKGMKEAERDGKDGTNSEVKTAVTPAATTPAVTTPAVSTEDKPDQKPETKA